MTENSTPQNETPVEQEGAAAPDVVPIAPPVSATGTESAPAAAPTSVPSPGKGFALTALILGIAALLGVAIPILNIFSAILAIVGLILGIVALTRATAKGLPLSGTIVSGVALVLSLVFIVAYIAGFANAVNEVRNDSSVVEEDSTESDAQPEQDEAPAPELGTRENPAPLGTTIEVTELGEVVYELTMGPSTLDATALVLAANQFNEAPPEGFQYALIPVTVTYLGDESGLPWVDFTIEFVSAAGTTHTESDSFAVAPAPTFMDINDLYNGASGTGNIVILIPTENASAGTWSVSTLFGDPFFFAAE